MYKTIYRYVICLIFLVVSLFSSNVYANKIDGYFEGQKQFNMLATIVDAGDTTYTISCGHILSSPNNASIPEKIVLNKFRYAYDSEQADNYNTPHLGDNIIISVKYNGSSYEIQNGVYMVNTVTYSSSFIFIPKELTKKEDILKLSALAYYIRSNGECVEYDFKSDSVYSKDGFEILPSKYLKTIETDKISGRQEETDKQSGMFSNESKWIVGSFIIIFGMLLGLVVLVFINKKIFG